MYITASSHSSIVATKLLFYLPFSYTTVSASEDRVSPGEVLVVFSTFSDELFVDLNAQARGSQEVNHTFLDCEDFRIVQIREQVEVSLVIVHCKSKGYQLDCPHLRFTFVKLTLEETKFCGKARW